MPHEPLPDWQEDALKRLREQQGVPTGNEQGTTISTPIHHPEMGDEPVPPPSEKRGVHIIEPTKEEKGFGVF